jgi:hypothetical protein
MVAANLDVEKESHPGVPALKACDVQQGCAGPLLLELVENNSLDLTI